MTKQTTLVRRQIYKLTTIVTCPACKYQKSLYFIIKEVVKLTLHYPSDVRTKLLAMISTGVVVLMVHVIMIITRAYDLIVPAEGKALVKTVIAVVGRLLRQV